MLAAGAVGMLMLKVSLQKKSGNNRRLGNYPTCDWRSSR
jgi:hypothetical protein